MSVRAHTATVSSTFEHERREILPTRTIETLEGLSTGLKAGCLEAALRLHRYLCDIHWTGHALAGPTQIGRVTWRVTRFVKAYTPWVRWQDTYIHMQTQGYWIQSNILLASITGDRAYLEIARRCADYVTETQLDTGAWRYPPVRERRHLISSVEGTWVSLGLLAAFSAFADSRYLEAALRWNRYQRDTIGYDRYRDGLSIRYWHRGTGHVTNVTVTRLRLLAELRQVWDGDTEVNDDAMIRFLAHSQRPGGEFHYVIPERPHFQCYQYNSFQCLDLCRYYELTGSTHVQPILLRLAAFLKTGVTATGAAAYDCFRRVPEVHYWTAALAAALRRTSALGLIDGWDAATRAYERVLAKQAPNGSFGFSEQNYRILSDSRSYPAPLSMLLRSLLYAGT